MKNDDNDSHNSNNDDQNNSNSNSDSDKKSNVNDDDIMYNANDNNKYRSNNDNEIPIQIFIKSVSGCTFIIVASPADSITNIKERIYAIGGTPLILQRLVMSSKPLEDGTILQHYGLERECTIHVTLCLLGGANPPLPRPSTSPVSASEILTWSRRNPTPPSAEQILVRTRGASHPLPGLLPAPSFQ